MNTNASVRLLKKCGFKCRKLRLIREREEHTMFVFFLYCVDIYKRCFHVLVTTK